MRADPQSAKALADAALAALSSAPVAAMKGAEELAAFCGSKDMHKVVVATRRNVNDHGLPDEQARGAPRRWRMRRWRRCPARRWPL